MDNSTKLQTQLETILYGKAWYGTPIYTVLKSVSFEAAYEKVNNATHSIAEMVMHMLAWTEEATQRMQTKAAGTPIRGDWPDVGSPEEQQWIQLIAYFKLANTELMQLISTFPAEQWADATNDDRETYTGYGATYEAMITGLIQHHVYHTGQISLLNKMING